MEKVTILGAGTMGHGIAQIFAQARYRQPLFVKLSIYLKMTLQMLKILI